jgi:SAM-dependent methyltransferase
MTTATPIEVDGHPPLSPGAAEQGRLWSEHPRDWAELQEATVRPAQVAVLDRIGIQPGTRLLDIGCGTGGPTLLARERGARVSGIDASPGMLEIARERVPDGDFRVGELLTLPWPEHSFDVVVGFNAFQYAIDPVAALVEARRVVKPDGWIGAMVWGSDEECEFAATFTALAPLMPQPPRAAAGPRACGEDIADWIRDAGLSLQSDERVDCPWTYPNRHIALRAFMSAGPVAKVIHHAGEQAVTEALTTCLAGFATAGGRYRFQNKFRALTARA